MATTMKRDSAQIEAARLGGWEDVGEQFPIRGQRFFAFASRETAKQFDRWALDAGYATAFISDYRNCKVIVPKKS